MLLCASLDCVQAGPTDIDLSSVAYGYHSTVQSWHQQQMGLLGLLVVARRGSLVNRVQPLGSQLQATLMPNDVDHLIPLLWMVSGTMRRCVHELAKIARLRERLCHCGVRVGAMDALGSKPSSTLAP